MTASRTPYVPSEPDQHRARDVMARVGEGELRLHTEDGDVTLPPDLARLVRALLGEVAQGHAVVVEAFDQELSTFEAARLLGVSRPFLIARLLDTGRIPSRRVGSHRRLRLQDVLAYQAEQGARREAADDLARETQDLGLH